MSAYLSLSTPMIEQEALLAALEEVGFGSDQVEVHETAVPLEGYEGIARPQVANLIVRRRFVGPASNDVGFLATPRGFQLVVSAFDRGAFGASWLARVQSGYERHMEELRRRAAEEERRRLEEQRRQLVAAQREKVLEQARRLGYRVQEEQQGEEIRLVLVKRVY